jgi:hypothetical protein
MTFFMNLHLVCIFTFIIITLIIIIIIIIILFFFEIKSYNCKGLVAGPEAFAEGIGKGTRSLLKNALSGVFGSASKFTDAVSGGIVKVGMDDEWEKERRIAALRKPKHVGEGLKQGMLGLTDGVMKGVSGVVMQPVKGFQEEGALGLVKGMGRGAAGLVLRPAVGVVDVFTRTAEGLQNMGKLLDSSAYRGRIRPPRAIGSNFDKLLRPYDWRMAASETALREVEMGKYAEMTWVDRFTLFPTQMNLQWITGEALQSVSFLLMFPLFFPF